MSAGTNEWACEKVEFSSVDHSRVLDKYNHQFFWWIWVKTQIYSRHALVKLSLVKVAVFVADVLFSFFRSLVHVDERKYSRLCLAYLYKW